MAQHAHLKLKRVEGELQRRKPNGFGGNPARTPAQHGSKISNEIEEAIEDFKDLPAVKGVDPSLILRIEVVGYVEEGYWEKLGLVVLSEDENKTLLVFSNDAELKQFRQRVDEYLGPIPEGQKGPRHAGFIEAIENVGVARAEDRVGKSLLSIGITKPNDFSDTSNYILDIELFHPSDDMQCDIFVYRLENILSEDDGKILNTYKGDQLLLCRVTASGKAIKKCLELPEVAAVDVPPKPDLQFTDIGEVTLDTIEAGAPPNDDAVVICIIDSGINSGHPLLEYATAGSLALHPSWPDADEAGHGTSVASMAAYGDVFSRTEVGNFDAPFWVTSARVLDAQGDFPSDVTVPEMMESAVRKMNETYGCRIFNISLGDPNSIYDGGKVGSWASTLDQLARDLDILIIVSSGNQNKLSDFGEGIIDKYPSYLFDPSSRILDPATAANVLTVGSLAHSNGLDPEDEDYVGVRPICDGHQPSPFTRTGPGIRGAIKPDLVDYGGSSVWDGPTKATIGGGGKSSAGVWTFHHEPVERLFKARSGTSFAAPIVAHKAAILLDQYPDAPANFLRAMLALSGETSEETHSCLVDFKPDAPLMACGNGVANVDHAILSDDSRVIFYHNDEITLDHFAVYEIPIPKIFQTTKGTREIKVSLAFDPPVRRTRADYLGATMGWRIIRGSNEKDVFDKFRAWEKKTEGDPPKFPSKNDCTTFPGSQLREKGTLQCARFEAKTDMSEYGDKYFVAAWCRRRWAPEEIRTQKFSIAVQLRHSADIPLYQALTVPVVLKA